MEEGSVGGEQTVFLDSSSQRSVAAGLWGSHWDCTAAAAGRAAVWGLSSHQLTVPVPAVTAEPSQSGSQSLSVTSPH